MLWHMGPRQSLSEVVGTHVVLDCKWIITVFLHTIPLPSPHPTPINVDKKWDTTLNRGGGLTFIEIQRFCGICPKTFETDCRSGMGAMAYMAYNAYRVVSSAYM